MKLVQWHDMCGKCWMILLNHGEEVCKMSYQEWAGLGERV